MTRHDERDARCWGHASRPYYPRPLRRSQKHTEDGFLHLNKVLKFPFDARIYYGAADFVQGSRLQVVALVSHDGLSDVIAKYKYGKRRGDISLSRLEAIKAPSRPYSASTRGRTFRFCHR